MTAATLATFDFIGDVLSGFRPHPNYYMPEGVDDVAFRHQWLSYDQKTFGYTQVPFAVMVWDDGLDYDMEGNAYFDDCPGDRPHGFYRTQKAAEYEAARLEMLGIDGNRITIVRDYWTPNYTLNGRGIED